MAPRKRRRTCNPTAPTLSSSPNWTLPADLVLEIIAHSDLGTLIRCAAACKLLRREILLPAFIRRVCQEPDGVVPSRPLVGCLDETDGFSLAHPATPAAASFAEGHLAPLVSRRAAGLLGEYEPVASRGGLVLLQRRDDDAATTRRRLRSHRLSDMCVYDPLSGERFFLPFPPDIEHEQFGHSYALLTAADGIGCSFLLLAVDMNDLDTDWCFSVQTASSDAAGEWGPVVLVENALQPWRWSVFADRMGAVVVLGGVAHWLVTVGNYVIAYDVGTGAAGWIELPKSTERLCGRHLGSLPDGRLCLFAADGLRVSVWVLSGDEWAQHAELDLSETVRSMLVPCEEIGQWEWDDFFQRLVVTELDQRSSVLLMWLEDSHDGGIGSGVRLGRLVLDMETLEIRCIGMIPGVPCEVDLPSRLFAMKNF